ncbi:MAG TPA: rhamnulokinase family protein [Friedmanniella sp.]
MAAVDLGATSGRVVVGRVGPGVLAVEAVHRFPNEPVRTPDGLHWNILELYRQVLVGLRRALEAHPDLLSIGIDSWGVDYGLVRGDRLTQIPFHYRDERTARGFELVHRTVSRESLYAGSGVQLLRINTVYQLAVDRADGFLDGTTALLTPDLFGWWLTGERVAEQTIASTTGLLDRSGDAWDTALVDALGYPRTLFPRLVQPGTVVGRLLPDVAAEVGAQHAVPVVAVGSHDTASAVVAVPLTGRNAAYISSGTWSLVGVELDEPVLTAASRQADFTNERGVDGRVRYHRNVMGLWLLNESIRAWERQGLVVDLDDLLRRAAAVRGAPVFETDHPSLLAAGDLPVRIAALCPDRTGCPPLSPAEVTRSILESLAARYASTLDDAERLGGVAIDTVHIVGGGSQNALLCQLTADRTGRRVLAGPVEATAIGNVLVQARAAGVVSGSLEELRDLVRRTHPPTEYRPAHD